MATVSLTTIPTEISLSPARPRRVYNDWTILHTDTRDFASEPFIDQDRLLDNNILSIFIQENDDQNFGRTGTPLHAIEYAVSASLE